MTLTLFHKLARSIAASSWTPIFFFGLLAMTAAFFIADTLAVTGRLNPSPLQAVVTERRSPGGTEAEIRVYWRHDTQIYSRKGHSREDFVLLFGIVRWLFPGTSALVGFGLGTFIGALFNRFFPAKGKQNQRRGRKETMSPSH